jgi:NADP-dependent 3-hydroxy acid dehydrogenase YdfG
MAVWLVTGATSGIGAALVKHIVERGDKVIASGRKVAERIGHLQSGNLGLLELDIAAGREHVHEQVKAAWDIFGHIDVLVNNAGVSGMKSAEEAGLVLLAIPPAVCWSTLMI